MAAAGAEKVDDASTGSDQESVAQFAGCGVAGEDDEKEPGERGERRHGIEPDAEGAGQVGPFHSQDDDSDLLEDVLQQNTDGDESCDDNGQREEAEGDGDGSKS